MCRTLIGRADQILTDEQIAQFGRFAAAPPDQSTLERFFFLDDADGTS